MIGPSAIATAAHVVCNQDYGGDGFATSGTIIPARADSSYPYGSANITGIVVYDAWTDDRDIEFDWAIVELDSNIGDSVGYLGLRYQSSSYNGTSISINGYPNSVNSTTTRIMYRSDGTISNSYTGLLRSTDTNLIHGMSGSPVYIYSSSSGYTAIAIATGGATTILGSKYNRFVRITQDFYNDMVEYRNIRV